MNPNSAIAGLPALLILALSVSTVFTGCNLVSEPSINSIDSGRMEGSTPKMPKLAPIVALFKGSGTDFMGSDTILTVGQSGRVLSWKADLGSSQPLLDLPEKVELAVYAPRSKLLAVAGKSGLALRSLLGKDPVKRLLKSRLPSRALALDFDAQEESLLIAGADARVYQWNFTQVGDPADLFAKSEEQRRKDLQVYIGHGSVVSAVVFHPSAPLFFSGDWSGTLYAWQTYDSDRFSGFFDKNLFGDRFFVQQAVRMQGAHQAQIGLEQLKISADGQLLAASYQDGTIELWKVRGFNKVFRGQAHQGLIYDLSFNPSGKQLFSIGRDLRLKVWQVEKVPENSGSGQAYDLRLLQELPVTGARKIAWLDDKNVVLAFQDGTLRRQSIETGK